MMRFDANTAAERRQSADCASDSMSGSHAYALISAVALVAPAFIFVIVRLVGLVFWLRGLIILAVGGLHASMSECPL